MANNRLLAVSCKSTRLKIKALQDPNTFYMELAATQPTLETSRKKLIIQADH